MATQTTSKKSARPKTLNRGATDAATRILAYLKRRKVSLGARWFGPQWNPRSPALKAFVETLECELDENIAWIENLSERANKRKGGLGRR